MRVRPVQPIGQANSAGDRIDLSNDVVFFREDEIWPDHSWQIVADFFSPRKFNQLFWFPGIEVSGDPLGLFAFNAELIELIASALKNKQSMPELLQVRERFFVDRKCIWREQPLFLSKEPFFRESSANDG